MSSFDVRWRGPQVRPPAVPARWLSRWMVALPGLPAATLAAAASLAEIEGAFLAHLECGNATATATATPAYALFLLLSAFPALWLLQTALIAVPAFGLALATRRRPVAILAVGLLACVVLPAVASAFFAWSGLPVYGSTCP
jgi:hypothetical protein